MLSDSELAGVSIAHHIINSLSHHNVNPVGAQCLLIGGSATDAVGIARRGPKVTLLSDDPRTLEEVVNSAALNRVMVNVSSDASVLRSKMFDVVVICDDQLPPILQSEKILDAVGVNRILMLISRSPLFQGLKHPKWLRMPTNNPEVVNWVRVAPISIVVPIYNAPHHLERLLGSIQKVSSSYPANWIFVDDCSPDPRIADILGACVDELNDPVRIIYRDRNGGVVAANNDGIRAAGADDVVLLNSDTIVTDDWLLSLVNVAYSAPDIGTVTPLSNEASCYSMFTKVTNIAFLEKTIRSLQLGPIDIPSGVSFCMYVKRDVFDRVGIFDSVFGRGYGDETDLCLRAVKAGYRNVLDRSCFVYHVGSVSMRAAGVVQGLSKTAIANQEIVSKRYPSFDADVQVFIGSGIIRETEEFILREYIRACSVSRRSVMMVLHNNIYSPIIGGTEYHVRDLVQALDSPFLIYVAYPENNGIGIAAQADGLSIRLRADGELGDIISNLRPSLIHVHEMLRLPAQFVRALIQAPQPKCFTIHDYNSVCEQYYLINHRGEYCEVPEEAYCTLCAQRQFKRGFDAPTSHRVPHQQLIDSCNVIISPSRAAVEVVSRALDVPVDKIRVYEHPYVKNKSPRHSVSPLISVPIDWKEEPNLIVAFLGYRGPQKGSHLASGIVSALSNNSSIKFVSIGSILDSCVGNNNVVLVNEYDRNYVDTLLRESGASLVVIPSPWPETFCYTLSEAWLSGIPVLVGPLGAPAERVKKYGGGIIASSYTVEAFVDEISRVYNSKQCVTRLKSEVAAMHPNDDFTWYKNLYSSLSLPPRETLLFPQTCLSDRDMCREKGGNEDVPPSILKIWRLRALMFPPGSRLEKVYLRLRKRVWGY